MLFALAILFSVALHECGHMWVARATGMKVRRYFVGFGPTLWSTMRPNRLGHTEYGVKAVPLGGFCDIAGMTSVDELAPEDRPYAMYRQKVWKRVAVLFAGPAMNFVIGLVLIYGIAIIWGLPNLHPPTTAIVGETALCRTADQQGQVRASAPARARRRKRASEPATRSSRSATPTSRPSTRWWPRYASSTVPTPFVVQRARRQSTITTVVDVTRPSGSPRKATTPTRRSERSASPPPSSGPRNTTRSRRCQGPSPSPAICRSRLGKSLAKIPTKVGALVHSIGGGERDPETPISVVGASIIGGDTVDHGLWVAFWFFLAQLNFVLGAINLLPLLPFDGGHIADRGVREDPQYDPFGARQGRRGAGELPQADARHLRRAGRRGAATCC